MDSKTYMRILVHTAFIDGKLHEQEEEVLEGFAKRLKLSRSQFKSILDEEGKGVRPSDFPSDPKEGATLFRHMARVVAADSEIHKYEQRLMENVGKKLGLSKDRVLDTLEAEMGSSRRGSKNQRSPAQPQRDNYDNHKADYARKNDYSQKSQGGGAKLSRSDKMLLAGVSTKLRVLGILAVLGTLGAGALGMMMFSYIGRGGGIIMIIALAMLGLAAVTAGLAYAQYSAAGSFKRASESSRVEDVMSGMKHLDLLFGLQILLFGITFVMNLLPRLLG